MMAETSGSPAFGDFAFVSEYETLLGRGLRHDLEHAFQAVQATPQGWEFLASCQVPANQGFMFWQHPKANEIKSKLREGHSGASAAMMMREMEAIAKLGWEQWVSLMRLEYSRSLSQKARR